VCVGRGAGQHANSGEELECRPSTLGLDHACVCIANGKTLLATQPISLEPVGGCMSNDISFSVRAVEINNRPERLSVLLSP
jgi:hypothetical protein